MKLKFTNQLWLMVAMLAATTAVFAQQHNPLDIANEYVRTHYQDWGLTSQDIDGMTVNDMYTDKTTGISRVFFLQRHQGIPVYNAIMNLNITKDGKVFYVGKRFVQNLASKVNTTVPVLNAEAAVQKLVAHLGLPYEMLRMKSQTGNSYVFDKGNIARQDITVTLSYQPLEKSAPLAWDILFAPVGNLDKWSTRVDAVVGDVLNEYNWTVYCKVDGSAFRHQEDDCQEHGHFETKQNFNPVITGALYNVWPSPSESPNHGSRTLMSDPFDPIASPFGWHDTDGAAGAEYTITRGNNVWAYQNRDNIGTSSGDEPDGGPDLHFDFPYQSDWEPEEYVDAAVVNLFYWTNFMHDFSYRMGFTEVNGNFQHNTYGNGGLGNDAIRARAQAGANTGNVNNANYVHETDGVSPSINMYVWNSAKSLQVLEPASVADGYDVVLPVAGEWGAGAYLTTTPVIGPAVFVEDAVPSTTDGCDAYTNAAAIQDKVALIDRGTCQFGLKAKRAQDAGAIAVIICNIAGGTALGGMSAGTDGGQVNIPTVLISVEDCTKIRQFAGTSLVISLGIPNVVPAALDGDLDNGIIAHEYGHGISIRMTGGPSASCLGNAEHMGEGWSDFMSLVTTVKPGDAGSKARGIGTYALRETVNGGGIRRFPYSTDMDVNPLTYADVAASTEVHDRGEVWTAMIWDMYWAFVEEYGWSADLYDETSGNYKATRLVFEGFQTQPCSPGFVDGRDAILGADMALYGGANQCLIWKVFARRGLGESADQGTASSATDQTEAFDIPCSCRDAISITKTMTPFIEPGQDIQVTIRIENCKTESVSNVTVTDQIPAGTQLKPGSSSVPASVSGGVISFGLGGMTFSQTQEITYTLTTPPDFHSVRHWIDDVANQSAFDNWLLDADPTASADNLWTITDTSGYTGNYSWFASNIEVESDVYLIMDSDVASWTVTGDRPALRIFHRYNTEGGADGGFIEVKNVNETQWERVSGLILRNDYPGVLQYGTLALPNIGAFSGNSGPNYEASYVDLSPWAGQEIHLRFRFSTDANTTVQGGGWFIDDIEFMDLLNYNGEACVTTAQGDQICVSAPEEGTIVQSEDGANPNSTVEKLQDVTMKAYPNPASNFLNIALSSETRKDVTISVLTVEGKVMASRAFTVNGNNHLSLDVSSFPSGFYFVKVSAPDGVIVQKVIID
jgi:extracellular elastinolytic metalloproteinase